ncbi:hypothetical protein [Tumebacillus permanentifrigoris]|uniref:Uncharacterized protein n=1 Tax=Tumebacillus permanentifrigoris TaxID=378543 RepID=A0A316DE55_9BACL|nr:hypothetical protein [Tumebacillus permanentifrigoris]PWK15469.1 hypothetical protein C7459_1035 [Tumebacillus permanentifrigoris]
MSTESKLREVTDSGQTVNITLSNNKPHLSDGEGVQVVTGRIVSTNSPDVVQVQQTDGAPVPVPVSRILIIE